MAPPMSPSASSWSRLSTSAKQWCTPLDLWSRGVEGNAARLREDNVEAACATAVGGLAQGSLDSPFWRSDARAGFGPTATPTQITRPVPPVRSLRNPDESGVPGLGQSALTAEPPGQICQKVARLVPSFGPPIRPVAALMSAVMVTEAGDLGIHLDSRVCQEVQGRLAIGAAQWRMRSRARQADTHWQRSGLKHFERVPSHEMGRDSYTGIAKTRRR